MDTKNRLAQVKCASTEGVAFPASHKPRQIGLPFDHLGWRMPIRPLRDLRDSFYTGPGEALTADANAVAHGFPILDHEIKIRVRCIDDDRADRFRGLVVNQRA